ncbi:zinc-binding alcohol dehydrogenase family protein [Sinobaca sp. H24]|uniref:zinc-binding alcohol dehydrogenase family protein n=1 Tax=Sinobaca sp. H24 TaxID=2923376 RepID=UPI002079B851|nr:zinc-binding alcohol dehydrogenase family protein [Sinobaca sp. H24]
MKAVGFFESLSIDNNKSLQNITKDKPTAEDHDILVRVKAVSVNPVDTKVRMSGEEKTSEAQVLGFDAAGVVEEVGERCQLFKPGDEVYYAGDVSRPGTNSEFHLVDERIVGRKPKSLSFAESAAMPLTTLTAWEGLFERMGISSEKDKRKPVLILGGAGGVGSVAIQLAKLAGLEVIATASREQSADWCRELGADHIINHKEELLPQLQQAGFPDVPYIFCLNDTAGHWEDMAEIVSPQGIICSIVETEEKLNLTLLQHKSAAFVWEFMFTRSSYMTDDVREQHRILNEAGEMMDKGVLRSTLTETLSPIDAEHIREGHEKVESGRMIGKVVIAED